MLIGGYGFGHAANGAFWNEKTSSPSEAASPPAVKKLVTAPVAPINVGALGFIAGAKSAGPALGFIGKAAPRQGTLSPLGLQIQEKCGQKAERVAKEEFRAFAEDAK